MSDEYLWNPHGDGSNDAEDVEIRKVEESLRQLRYRPDPEGLQRKLGAAEAPPGHKRSGNYRWLAAAAALVVTAGAAWIWWDRTHSGGWRIASQEGLVRVEGGSAEELRTGGTLETGADGRATLQVGMLGQVEVAESSKVRLIRAGASEQRMAIDVGSIEAIISAPPRLFVVDTPAAVATDLGCAYVLSVEPDGSGLLRVKVGWVSFEAQGQESFIPAGAAAHTKRGFAPGTPFFIDASAVLQEALVLADFGGTAEERMEARRRVVEAARPRDALTLWHLLTRGSEAERALAYDRMAQIIAVPRGVSREGVLRMQREDLDRLWTALDLGPTAWWRLWKGPVPR